MVERLRYSRAVGYFVHKVPLRKFFVCRLSDDLKFSRERESTLVVTYDFIASQKESSDAEALYTYMTP